MQVILSEINPTNYSYDEFNDKNKQIVNHITTEFKNIEQSVVERRKRIVEGKRRLKDIYCNSMDELDYEESDYDMNWKTIEQIMNQYLDMKGLMDQNKKRKDQYHKDISNEFIQSRITLLMETRKNLFDKYWNFSRSDDQKKENNFEKFMKEISKKEMEKESKNKKKIEKYLMKFIPGLQNMCYEDQIEQSLYKKFKLSEENGQQQYKKIMGYKHNDFRKIRKYQIEVERIPELCCDFEESRQMDELFPEEKQKKMMNQKNKNQEYSLENNPFQFRTRPLQTETYDDYDQIPYESKQKEREKYKLNTLNEEEMMKQENTVWKKNWDIVCKQIQRLYKYTQREKFEKEKNCKAFAFGCCKEVKRKAQKSQRIQKEFGFRAKKIYREVAQYWRKREREMNEIKKKKERLEMEIRKKQEEERENMLQKKRLEFLMKQSDIYAHFMAKKLGMNQQKDDNIGQNEQVKIDEEQALLKVQKIINDRREEVNQYDKENLQQTEEQNKNMNNQMILKEDLLLDLSKVDQSQLNTLLETPKTFIGQLKEYQLNGLRWLDNLYEQGINGILADEMGLGKTIQAIALLTHLTEQKNNWGPHLIVAPSSTLFNWQQEISRFSPKLKILPYWGSLKQRKMLRKFFNVKKHIGTEQGAYHIVISSYNIVVADEKSFQRMKWQYVILDEAQAIKSINSQRWRTLLNFQSRNKLLLTGTPIQNTMAELWALLHFIMPKLFDSHDQFQEWFSKDIEAHSVDQKQLNQHQLQRLHSILKPFMLRRIKKDVEHEIGEKKEIVIYCQMTQRQRELYHQIKMKLPVQEFFKMFESKSKVEDLMNLVMQFRKVCNHPELFERRSCRSPFRFSSVGHYTGNQTVPYNQLKSISYNSVNPIEYRVSKFMYDQMFSQSRWINQRNNIFNIFRVQNQMDSDGLGFIRLMGLSQYDLEQNMTQTLIQNIVIVAHFLYKQQRIMKYSQNNGQFIQQYMLLVCRNIRVYDEIGDYLQNYNMDQYLDSYKSSTDIKSRIGIHRMGYNIFIPKVKASIPSIYCSSIHFTTQQMNHQNNHQLNMMLFGQNFKKGYSQYMSDNMMEYKQNRMIQELNMELECVELLENRSKIEIPDYTSLIGDSAKLKHLDKLLVRLKSENHRCLIFCQMTKMMDILEDYLYKKGYTFFRLDGSSNIVDRRDMVKDFQKNNNIFVFLLSTRAGGLGITLTAADTVIFYDNDWNPTMDAQATDRAHRIGQTEKVTVYKLITKSTIEERILKRAQQKQNVQSTVYSGGAFKGDIFKPENVKELLFDDNEIDMGETNKFISHGVVKNKNKKVKKDKDKDKDKYKKNKNPDYNLAQLMEKEDSD